MSPWQRCYRYTILIASLSVAGLLSLGVPAREEIAKETSAYPLHVLILRHAEKPDNDDPHLTSRGAARAAAFPALFLIPPTFPTRPAPFPTPDFLFAARESKHSNRPVETVTPLSKALAGMPIHSKHKDEDFQAVVNELFGEAKYAGKTSLICWHHGKIHKLTLAILAKAKNAAQVKEKVPPTWDDGYFDRVWQINFDPAGQATFANRPQQLLFKDAAQ